MTQEAAVPDKFHEQIRQIAREEAAKVYRSASNRNASISEGGRLTIKGGALVVEAPNGDMSVYFGGVLPALPDGTGQPGFVLYREDGSIAAALYDPFPEPDGPGDYKQFFAIYDRSGNRILSDDTASGQGMSRPFLPGVFYPSRDTDWPTVTSSTFTTVYRAQMPHQHPTLFATAWGTSDTSGGVGEIRMMVNGTQLDVTKTTSFGTVAGFNFGPAAAAGTYLSTLTVEVQARLASGTGGVRVGVGRLEGRQS